ncbi:MAG: sulfur carrier protein ThiS adenylyltransferase ThiF [Lentisphaeria bacterium]|nr:sulfur carrier protein ThiS adenylyltransferase ThiF [Lentisphaeria bacterium]
MKIFVNEIALDYNGKKSVGEVRRCYKADADILLCNEGLVTGDYKIKENDRISLIKRGEVPSRKDMENLMQARNPHVFTAALKDKVVGIAGLGGLGSVVAIALARSFVKKLVLVDYDVVEPSNLNRQQYFTSQIGETKVSALSANIKQINPYIEVECVNRYLTASNSVEILNEVDIVAECFDSAPAKAMLVEQVLTGLNCKIVAASGVAGYKKLNQVTCKQISSRFFLVGDGDSEAKPGLGLTAAKVGIAANLQAAKIIELLIEDYNENKS